MVYANGRFIVTGEVTVGSLDLTDGGFLIVDGTLTVTGSTVISGGYLVGPGMIDAEGGLQLGQSTGGQQFIYGTTIINDSTTVPGTIFGASQIGISQGSLLVNLPGASLTIQGGGGCLDSDGSTFIANEGALTAVIGVGATYAIDFANVVNVGTLAVTSGTLDLQGYGQSVGTITVTAASTLILWSFDTGSSLSEAGNVQFPNASRRRPARAPARPRINSSIS